VYNDFILEDLFGSNCDFFVIRIVIVIRIYIFIYCFTAQVLKI